MSESMQPKLRSAVVALAPLLALIGFVWHPYVARQDDMAAAAATAAGSATRWAASHLLLAVAFGFAVLAIFALRMYLHEAGEDVWSFVAVPFVAVGAPLLVAVIGAEGIAAPAVARAGGDVEAFLVEAEVWTLPLYLVAALLLAIGWLSLAAAVSRSHVLDPAWTWAVVVALVVLAVMAFVPFGWALIVAGAASVVAFWPLAWRMWVGPAEHPVVTGAHPSPA